MPIATCFIKNNKISKQQWDTLSAEWAQRIGVDVKDICLTMVTGFIQSGQTYEALVQLSLPSLWAKEDIKTIQMELLSLLSELLKVSSDQIFILTTIIQSGHVVENGKVVKW